MFKRAVRRAVFTLGVGMLACADTAGPGDLRLTPGLHVIAGADQVDTVNAVLSQPLEVQVADAEGRPVRNAAVRFTPLTTTRVTLNGNVVPDVRTASLGVDGTSTADLVVLDAATNVDGKARVRVRLGSVSGDAGVIVQVNDGGLVDTATFIVRPGNAAGVEGWPVDTTMAFNSTYALRAGVTDRNGNLRAEPVELSVFGGAVSTTGHSIQSASAATRAIILVTGAVFTDTAYVSVVPSVMVAAVYSDGSGSRLVTIDLDGSQYTDHGSAPPDMNLAWSPDGAVLAATTGGRLYTMALGGSLEELPLPALFARTRTPSFSADGAEIYVSTKPGSQPQSIWRQTVVGDTTRRVTEASASVEHLWPTLSPSAPLLAWISLTEPAQYNLHVMNVLTDEASSLGIPARIVRWAPDGAWLASIVGQRVTLARPDGSEQTIVSPSGRLYGSGPGGLTEVLDWTPDSEFVMAQWYDNDGGSGLDLIEVESGMLLPIPWAAGFHAVVIQPD